MATCFGSGHRTSRTINQNIDWVMLINISGYLERKLNGSNGNVGIQFKF